MVNVCRGRYYCHRCGSGGNALELWATVQGVNFQTVTPPKRARRDLPKADVRNAIIESRFRTNECGLVAIQSCERRVLDDEPN